MSEASSVSLTFSDRIFAMKLFGFRGGIHPPEHKQQTEHTPIQPMPIPPRVILPLQQHIGAMCEALVNVGDEVREGQKIGEAKSFIAAPVHASISGKVVAIENHVHPAMAKPVRSIVIEAANPQETASWDKIEDWSGLSPKEVLDRIQAAGIVGMGGAAFPTHVKLSPPRQSRVSAVILNGVECEPYLTSDHRLMVERPLDVIEGLKIILHALNVKQGYIAIEQNKPDAIELMQKHAAATNWKGAAVEVVPLKVKYPQGAEKQLIKTVLGKEVPSGGLPFDVEVVVQNVGTAFAIYEAVAKNKPLIERIVTVTGNGVKNAQNLLVRLGTPFSTVIDYAGGATVQEDSLKVIMGGPMMGLAQYSLDVPVIKGTSGILVLSQESEKKLLPCVKCGACVRICPMNLMPNRLAEFSERGDFAACEAYNVRDCIECGSCTYICPSARPIVHLVKYAKLNLSKTKKP